MAWQRSPLQLAQLAMGGAAIAALPCILQWLPLPPVQGPWHSIPGHLWALHLRLLMLFAPFVVGGAVALWAQRQLRLGFLDDTRSKEEFEPVRRLVQNPFWRWSAFGLLGLGLVAALLSSHHFGGLLCSSLFPLQMAQTIDRAFFPKPSKPVSVWPTLSEVRPLRSDHWGEERVQGAV